MSDAKLFKKRSPFNEDPKLKREGMIGKAAQRRSRVTWPMVQPVKLRRINPMEASRNSSEHSVRPANGPIVTVCTDMCVIT